MRFNSRYVTGWFNTLPTCVHEDLDKFLHDCFREEAIFLKKCFKNALLRKGIKNIAKRYVGIPHKRKIGSLAFCGITISSAFR